MGVGAARRRTRSVRQRRAAKKDGRAERGWRGARTHFQDAKFGRNGLKLVIPRGRANAALCGALNLAVHTQLRQRFIAPRRAVLQPHQVMVRRLHSWRARRARRIRARWALR